MLLKHRRPVERLLILLLEVKLPYHPVCPSVGLAVIISWSVGKCHFHAPVWALVIIIIIIFVIIITYFKCNFPMTPHVRPL